ncbi:MAG: aspartate--tRNA ligase [Phycisphaerales bacterium]|jgi:aspartyl-tRNA synthetase|nr:aspartate--tRNA ligase [Phycisphaerales bacterium]
MLKRTHRCGELRASDAGKEVVLSGWVNAYRHFGEGLVFLDVRDREGVTQLVLESDSAPAEVIEAARKARNEDVISAKGVVRVRAGTPNKKIATGEVEVVVSSFELLSKTDKPPFLPEDPEGLPAEEVRLKHRYVDLRRVEMQQILRTRHRVAKCARDYFDANGFLEIETPILCRSTPEGARDFLVPSRLQGGMWYALPQSPQLFKQILMISGCDRYLQICRCFRDEDPRADRQAEFTQIDLEMSFVEREDVMQTMEGFARVLWKEIKGVDIGAFPRISYQEAMDRYGIDRPDTRFGLELVDVSDLAKGTEFKVFHDALAKRRGVVKAIRVPGAGEKMTRKVTDAYGEFVKGFGAGGLPFAKVTAAGFEGGATKFLEPIRAALVERLGLEVGDVVLFGADSYGVCTKALGELRLKVARDLGLIDQNKLNFLWVVDFPMFEFDEASGRYYALHHPFTAPRPDQIERFMNAKSEGRDEVEAIVSAGYDMVCNGSEVGGGSIRIHRQDVQSKVFDLLGLTREEAQVKFSFLLDALRFGAPPHGGIAFGLDRLVMHLCGTDNIRDVIAFPKTQNGADLMSQAPNVVDAAQLQELHVRSTL